MSLLLEKKRSLLRAKARGSEGKADVVASLRTHLCKRDCICLLHMVQMSGKELWSATFQEAPPQAVGQRLPSARARHSQIPASMPIAVHPHLLARETLSQLLLLSYFTDEETDTWEGGEICPRSSTNK